MAGSTASFSRWAKPSSTPARTSPPKPLPDIPPPAPVEPVSTDPPTPKRRKPGRPRVNEVKCVPVAISIETPLLDEARGMCQREGFPSLSSYVRTLIKTDLRARGLLRDGG